MKHRFVSLIAILSIAVPLAAWAQPRTVILDVHHAGCVLCGPIVKASLLRVAGVAAVQVSQADPMADVTATVRFDDSVTTVDALIAATTKAGYPSEVRR
jgi:mercuric ion binding protein